MRSPRFASAVCFLLLVLLAAPARPGVNRWTPFAPGSPRVIDLAVAPGDPLTLYAIVDQDSFPETADSALFRSRDGGQTWIWWGLHLDYGVERVALDAADPQLLAIANLYGDVFRSVDGGRRWTQVRRRSPSALYDRTLSLASSGGTLYLGGSGGLLASRDAGQTWPRSFDQGPVLALAAHPSAPQTLYLTSQSGVWKSDDGGRSWNLSFSRSGLQFKTLAIAPRTPSTVYAASSRVLYASQNGGRTWSRRSDGLAPIVSLAVDGRTATTLYAGGPGGLAVSRDGGRNWETTSRRNGTVLAVDPDRAGHVYAGTRRNGLTVSESSARSWRTPLQRGLGLNLVTLLEADPRHPSTFYLSRRIGDQPSSLQSHDDGVSWQAFQNRRAPTPPSLWDLDFNPAEPDVVYAAAGKLYRVENGGATWTEIPPVPGVPDLLSIHLLPGGALLTGGGLGAYRSPDGGATWETVLTPDLPDGFSRNVGGWIPDPFNPEILYTRVLEYRTGPDDRLFYYRSRDGGRTWRRILADALALAPDPHTPGRLYAGLRGGTVLRSEDAGTTWEPLSTIPSTLLVDLVVDPKRPAILLAATFDAGVQISRDGGRTWSPLNVGLTRQGIDRIREVIPDPTTLGRFVILPVDGGAFELTDVP